MKIVFTANGRCASAAAEPAGQPITAGSRVLVAKISGTYLILGQIY